jgi:hypothetical protein
MLQKGNPVPARFTPSPRLLCKLRDSDFVATMALQPCRGSVESLSVEARGSILLTLSSTLSWTLSLTLSLSLKICMLMPTNLSIQPKTIQAAGWKLLTQEDFNLMDQKEIQSSECFLQKNLI